jgi:hypothetical protein
MELSLKDIKELLTGNSDNNNSFVKKGSNYLIRTVTMIYTGKIEDENKESFLLSSCAWIPETERWTQSLKNCEFKEVELYPENEKVILFKGAIIDMCIIDKLPKIQK